jgi:hypothetical protein
MQALDGRRISSDELASLKALVARLEERERNRK